MNFIVYDDEVMYVEDCKTLIDRLLAQSKINYKIFEFFVCDKQTRKMIRTMKENKIYILGMDVCGKSGVDLAKKIRKSGDWLSPIILIKKPNEKISEFEKRKLLMLDVIDKDDNFKDRLCEDLKLAFEITLELPSITFTYRGDYYNIHHNDIFYIEKNLNNNSSIIATLGNKYQINKTICELEEELRHNNKFFKSHRSCIINLDKIMKVDFNEGIVYFKDRKTNLLSRSNKKKLKQRLKELNGSFYL